jgi:SSS family solute:Na+ symporter
MFPAGTVVGLPALLINLVLAVTVSLLTKRPPASAIAVGIPEAATTGTDAGADVGAGRQSVESV